MRLVYAGFILIDLIRIPTVNVNVLPFTITVISITLTNWPALFKSPQVTLSCSLSLTLLLTLSLLLVYVSLR